MCSPRQVKGSVLLLLTILVQVSWTSEQETGFKPSSEYGIEAKHSNLIDFIKSKLMPELKSSENEKLQKYRLENSYQTYNNDPFLQKMASYQYTNYPGQNYYNNQPFSYNRLPALEKNPYYSKPFLYTRPELFNGNRRIKSFNPYDQYYEQQPTPIHYSPNIHPTSYETGLGFPGGQTYTPPPVHHEYSQVGVKTPPYFPYHQNHIEHRYPHGHHHHPHILKIPRSVKVPGRMEISIVGNVAEITCEFPRFLILVQVEQ